MPAALLLVMALNTSTLLASYPMRDMPTCEETAHHEAVRLSWMVDLGVGVALVCVERNL